MLKVLRWHMGFVRVPNNRKTTRGNVLKIWSNLCRTCFLLRHVLLSLIVCELWKAGENICLVHNVFMTLWKCTCRYRWFCGHKSFEQFHAASGIHNQWFFGEFTRQSCMVCSIYKWITNVGQSDVNLSLLALLCFRILLMQGGVYYLPCRGWALGFLPTYLVYSIK